MLIPHSRRRLGSRAPPERRRAEISSRFGAFKRQGFTANVSVSSSFRSLLLSHISYLSQRSYVFQPYTWDAKTKANAVLDGRSWRSSRIPLNVFISGPTAGGSFAKGDETPRAVNVGWWEKVCPPGRRTVLDVRKEHALWKVDGQTEGKVILERWAERLKDMQDLCVEVTGPTILDFEWVAIFCDAPAAEADDISRSRYS